MNILFLISSEGNGAGGHFNSLYQISMEVGRKHNVKVILLGKGKSPIVESSPHFDRKISVGHGLKDFQSLRREMKKTTIDFQPDIIHCFDTNSLNRVILSRSFKHTPIVLNKCGGRNPLKNNHQHADAIVVFSKENQDWYLNNKNYDNSSIYLIPNRVRELNKLPLDKQIEKASENKITFVRISRLGGAYEHTLLQTYSLLDKLSEDYPVELFVIGRIQNEERFNELRNIAQNKDYDVRFITDERAFKGSDFLYLADFVIGTGRSFMEATSLSIPTLTPAKNTKIPILVNKNNVGDFLATNFSERNVAPNKSEENTLSEIEKLYKDEKYRGRFRKETKEIFDEFFCTEKILEKYEKVYLEVSRDYKKSSKRVFKNFPYLLRYFLKGY